MKHKIIYQAGPEAQAPEHLKSQIKTAVRTALRAEGVDLTDADVAYWLDIIDHLNPAGMPSLRQDVLARRPTEVELFSGTINRLGAAHGIPTPVNERFYAAIKALEASW